MSERYWLNEMRSAQSVFCHAELHFSSAPCSQYADALATVPSHPIVAYISHNNAVVLDLKTCALTDIIPISRAPLNSIKLVLLGSRLLLLVVASDGQLTICSKEEHLSVFRFHSSVKLHDTSCLAFDAVEFESESDRHVFLASVSDSALVTTLLRCPLSDPPETEQLSVHRFPSRFDGPAFIPQTISVHKVSSKDCFIATGGTDRRISIFHGSLSGDITLLTRIPVHRDWVRSLIWTSNTDGKLLLASASSDSSVRLFLVAPMNEEDPPQPLHLQFELYGTVWAVRAVALLDEHSAPVRSVRFGRTSGQLRLLSASMDGTIAMWDITRPDDPNLLSHFGLLGGHSVHAMGFVSVALAASRENSTDTVIAVQLSGAVNRWEASERDGSYVAQPAVSGHNAPIRQVAWSPDGSFLLSSSDDKSVRAFVAIGGRFEEWARPQVHGHAISSIAFCNVQGSSYVSAAEERMLRVFDAPDTFRVAGRKISCSSSAVVRATLPELGLSNKPVFSDVSVRENENSSDADDENLESVRDIHEANGDEKIDDMKVALMGAARGDSASPLEEELKQSTLWPETAKLYGHGNEVVKVASDPASATIASACRAQSAQNAEIIIWDIMTGVEQGRLLAHDLSVTDMRFSSNGMRLLSVSRDRSVAVFERSSLAGTDKFLFQLVKCMTAVHARVIYSCTWIDNLTFATAGRDKWIRLFRLTTNATIASVEEIAKLKLDASVSAVDCTTRVTDDARIIAIGLETGDFCLVQIHPRTDGENVDLKIIFRAGDRMRCGDRITTIQWRPFQNERKDSQTRQTMHLAIGSEDMSLRILAFTFDINSDDKPP